MFQKILVSIGIGNAQVDTKLTRVNYSPGDFVEGVVDIRGGQAAQQIDAIYLTIYTTYIKEVNDTKVSDEAVVARFEVGSGFTIQANERTEIPFRFQLPLATPITAGHTKIWIQTELAIPLAVDPNDRDYIDVRPTALMSELLAATKRLGFRLQSADCEKAPRHLQTAFPFVQEFEFKPTGQYRSYLDELELIVLNETPQGIDLLVQVDRKARGLGSLFAEALDLDESFVRLSIRQEQVAQIEDIVRQTIERHK